MSDDWEDAADEPEAELPVDKWAGEDEDEPITESWDADPEEAERQRKAAAAAAAANAKPAVPVISARKKKQQAEEEKKQKEREAQEAENDPVLKAQRKAEIVERARKRDAALAASLLGVDISDVDYVPPSTDRDDGSDIAGGGEALTEKERQEVRAAGLGVEDVDWTDDASVDKLADSISKKAVELPSNAKNSARLLRFLKTVSNALCDPMKLDDVAELRRVVTAKHAEMTAKQKLQQKGKKAATAAAGGTAGPKKANTVKLSSGGGGGGGRNTYGDELDDYAAAGGGGDEDFM